MRPPTWPRAVWRLIRFPVIPVVLYLALRPVLASVSESHGFGSPGGMGLGYLLLTATVQVLRLIALVIVPAWLVYRVVAGAVKHLLRDPG
ncbi:hypothetical protein [Nocardia tengchongensis]